MSRYIEIKSCNVCPHRDHRGAFGRIAYVPKCRLTNETLPYTVTEANGLVCASGSGEIPESCPLKKLEV